MRDLLNAALARRESLSRPDLNALRLIDGEGDRLPGIYLEQFADHWLLSTLGEQVPHEVASWLRDQGRSVYWKRLHQHQKESPVWLNGPEISAPFLMLENGVASEISFHSGYSQGIFLDQRDNRAEVRQRMQQGGRLLNTFAYTGAFSVHAAMAGAETTTLDLSQIYLDWAKRNFQHNELDPSAHHFCKGDTFHWLKRFAKQGRQFDGVVLDPPTFSRDEKGKVFRVESDYGELVTLAKAVLAPGGWILCCHNFRQQSSAQFEKVLLTALPRGFRASPRPMPKDFTDESYLKIVWVES